MPVGVTTELPDDTGSPINFRNIGQEPISPPQRIRIGKRSVSSVN